MKWIETVGGRKAFLVFWFGNLTGLLTWFAKVSGEQFVTIVIALVAAFVTGNVWQKVGGKKDHEAEQP
jgi:hypothetical protein